MKKGDFIIIAVCLLICGALFFAFKKQSGKTVTVKKDNAVVYEGSLFTDKTVSLDGNEIVIKNGKAVMKSAKCKNQICVHTGEIENKGENIICLPNRVVVEIK